ncbi:hypothetical protein WICPIJ_004780 [Wickerhamomyces pijperi]|uniref:Uncharacterized protein n=1 Tax=Wickerhamomyces pijperi TaxID=599730 RepID=A0A9P8Q4S5_WICPI|nr:hypothetical protein WICPIJ_004780 [Wickerhamomyces pijperi]
MAWEDSKAGMIPSNWESSLKPSKASASTGGVGTTTNTGNNGVWQLTVVQLLELGLGFLTDDRLEGSNQGWVWVRTNSRTNNVVSGFQVGDPRSEGFRGGVS